MSPGLERLLRLYMCHTGHRVVGHERSRARQAQAASGTASMEEYAAHIARDEVSFSDFVDRLTVDESYFFRGPELFEALQRSILPDIAARRPPGHVLQVWSAGCSAGEEPYSLAITLEESAWRGRYRVLATDLSEARLGRARRREYSTWRVRGLEAATLRRYFEPAAEGHRLSRRVAERVDFQRHNLWRDSYPSGFDIIVCRNVLLYFDEDAVAHAARSFHRSLSEGGVLITGPADPPLQAPSPSSEFQHLGWGGCLSRLPESRLCAPTANLSPRSLRAPQPTRWRSGEAARRSLLRLRSRSGEEATARRSGLDFASGSAEARRRLREALLALQGGRVACARRELRAALLLDPELVMGHLAQGVVLRSVGDESLSRGAFRAAERLCAALAPSARIPCSEGQTAGDLLVALRRELRS